MSHRDDNQLKSLNVVISLTLVPVRGSCSLPGDGVGSSHITGITFRGK